MRKPAAHQRFHIGRSHPSPAHTARSWWVGLDDAQFSAQAHVEAPRLKVETTTYRDWVGETIRQSWAGRGHERSLRTKIEDERKGVIR